MTVTREVTVYKRNERTGSTGTVRAARAVHHSSINGVTVSPNEIFDLSCHDGAVPRLMMMANNN